MALAGAAPSPAATYRPNKLGDHPPNGCTRADCTLREAVIKANGHGGRDAIVLKAGKTYRRSGAGTNEDAARDGDLDITDPLSIRSSNRRPATVDAKRNEPVFAVQAPAGFKRLRIVRGTNDTGPGAGGIDASARISVSNSKIARNTGVNGGGIQGADAIVLRRSKVTDNVGLSHGGGLSIGDRARIVDSTVAGNEAGQSGGGFENFNGSVLLRDSTISGNGTTSDGGGIANTGALRIVNSTISDNSANGQGGGMWQDSGASTMNAVTVVRNRSDVTGPAIGSGGGLATQGGSVTLRNSVIGLNTSGLAAGPDCFGGFTTAGHNLVGSTSGCLGFGGSGDLTDLSPAEIKIGKLAANGGPTRTAALRRGSAAINRAGSDAPDRDQRGKRRRNPDIGAYERSRRRR